MILGDLGAEVIKIERPFIGDDSRGMGPLWEGEGVYHLQINRNKRSIVIDLKTEEGKELLYKFVKDGDVFVSVPHKLDLGDAERAADFGLGCVTAGLVGRPQESIDAKCVLFACEKNSISVTGHTGSSNNNGVEHSAFGFRNNVGFEQNHWKCFFLEVFEIGPSPA